MTDVTETCTFLKRESRRRRKKSNFRCLNEDLQEKISRSHAKNKFLLQYLREENRCLRREGRDSVGRDGDGIWNVGRDVTPVTPLKGETRKLCDTWIWTLNPLL